MTHTPKTALQEFNKSGSVTLRDELKISDIGNSQYQVSAILPESEPKRIFFRSFTPTMDELAAYLDSIETVSKWDELGRYDDVNGWEFTITRNSAEWRTSGNNYVRLADNVHYTVTTSKISRMFINDLITASSKKRPVELAIAIILNQMIPREFDYQVQKYDSMYHNLQEITGIGKAVARELLVKYGCDNYTNVKDNIRRTDCPDNYIGDALQEINEKISLDEPLVDPSVIQKYSDIVVVNSI